MADVVRSSTEEIQRRKEPTAPANIPIGKLMGGARTVLSAVLNRIPLELAWKIAPEKQTEILRKFDEEAANLPAKAKVDIMLRLLEEYFPHLKHGSQEWLDFRSHFLGRRNLWGKQGEL